MTPTAPSADVLADSATVIAEHALAFGRISRAVCRHPDGSPESDTDHTVALAWFAPAIAAACEPSLDAGLVAQFAVVHDAVEVFAGDTPTLRITPQERAGKTAREQAAAARWQAELGSTLPWLPAMITRYEAQHEPEARFTRAADKIAPKFLHLLSGCADLAEYGVTAGELEEILTAQRRDIASYAGEFPVLLALYDEMAARELAALRATEHEDSTGADDASRQRGIRERSALAWPRPGGGAVMPGPALHASASADLVAVRSRFALTAADYAALLAACRAAVAADAAGDPDPLGYVRDLLDARRQLPPRGASPLIVLADARTALHMTGWHAIRDDSPPLPTHPAAVHDDARPYDRSLSPAAEGGTTSNRNEKGRLRCQA